MGQCEISMSVVPLPAGGTFTLDETLYITGKGAINAGAAGITLNITGGLTMEVPSTTGGSQITADVTGIGAVAGTINITTTGDIVLHGNGIPAGQPGSQGALIEAMQSSGSCMGGFGGTININAGGNITTEAGSEIDVDARCSAGSINITATGTIDIDGLVSSAGRQTGTGGVGQPPGGGPITINAGCVLTVSDTGVVVSQGKDPGADLVHLQGCQVIIDGQVISTGSGHALPSNPPNHCHVAGDPDKPTIATSCIEIWSGTTIVVDSTPPHTGEVNADGISNTSSQARSWIDMFANGNIDIIGDTSGPYAVHANRSVGTNSTGGVIKIKSKSGADTATGLAVQANATPPGGDGGKIVIQAGGAGSPAGDVNFGTIGARPAGSIQAKGSNAGTNPKGGEIDVQSFNGSVLGTAGGELNATGPGGVVNLTACIGNPATTYAGVVTGTETDANSCGGMPDITVPLPANCSVNGNGTISGMKTEFNNNVSSPGVGWVIFLDTNGNSMLDPGEPNTTTDAMGMYTFPNVAAGTYHVCEQLKPNFLPATPQCVTVMVSACASATVNFNNDFSPGGGGQCPEDPKATCTKSVTGTAGPGTFVDLQSAVNAAAQGDTICMFTNTVENVFIKPTFPLIITQCTLGKVTAADDSLPTIDVEGNVAVTIKSLETSGGSIGFLIDGNGHTLKSIRAHDAVTRGVDLEGNSNSVSINRVDNNGTSGVFIAGDKNTVKGGQLTGNSYGIFIDVTGSSNTINGSTVQQSLNDGFHVLGSSNVIKSCKANKNNVNGYALLGNTNQLLSNQGDSNGNDGVLVTGNNNVVNGNKMQNDGHCEFEVSGTGTTDNGGKNTANGTAFTNIEAGGCFK